MPTTDRGDGKRHTWIEALSIIFALIAGLITILFSSWDPLFRLLHVSVVEIRASLGAALSIVIILAGFLIALYHQGDRLNQEITEEVGKLSGLIADEGDKLRGKIEEECRSVLEKLISRTPQLSLLEVVTSDTALAYLAKNIPHARRAWNTRISCRDILGSYDTANGREYRERLEAALGEGLEFREVISTGWVRDAETLRNNVAQKNQNHCYKYKILDKDVPTFSNFIIICYQDGREEALAGWLTSRAWESEEPILICRHPRVVDHFHTWYHELQQEATTSPQPPTTS